ncbi:MAG: hypothetical protein WCP38_03220 [Chloroflexota bacterium]
MKDCENRLTAERLPTDSKVGVIIGRLTKMTKTYLVFTHYDLDGAVSLLAFQWARPGCKIISYPMSNLDVGNGKIKKIYDTEGGSNFSVVLLDLALREEFLDMDLPNVTIIDHHASSADVIPKFKNAKILWKDTTSCAKWIYENFLKDKNLSKEQKALIALADDFDCYALKDPRSYQLNMVFWECYRNKWETFVRDYRDGFVSFSLMQIKQIESVLRIADIQAENTKAYIGNVIIEGKEQCVAAFQLERNTSQLMDALQRMYPEQQAYFFINTKTGRISLRSNMKHPDKVDVKTFAEKYCEGAGHVYAAGGKITEKFLELTKNLHEVG